MSWQFVKETPLPDCSYCENPSEKPAVVYSENKSNDKVILCNILS